MFFADLIDVAESYVFPITRRGFRGLTLANPPMYRSRGSSVHCAQVTTNGARESPSRRLTDWNTSSAALMTSNEFDRGACQHTRYRCQHRQQLCPRPRIWIDNSGLWLPRVSRFSALQEKRSECYRGLAMYKGCIVRIGWRSSALRIRRWSHRRPRGGI